MHPGSYLQSNWALMLVNVANWSPVFMLHPYVPLNIQVKN